MTGYEDAPVSLVGLVMALVMQVRAKMILGYVVTSCKHTDVYTEGLLAYVHIEIF